MGTSNKSREEADGFARLEKLITDLRDEQDRRFGELSRELSDMRSLASLQVESARASARARENNSRGFDFFAKPPGQAFREPADAWVPRSDYETD